MKNKNQIIRALLVHILRDFCHIDDIFKGLEMVGLGEYLKDGVQMTLIIKSPLGLS